MLDSALELSNFCYQNAGFTEGFRAERSHLDRAQCVAPAPPVVSTLSPLADSAVPTELVSRRVMRRHGWTMIGFSWCVACPFFNVVVGSSENSLWRSMPQNSQFNCQWGKRWSTSNLGAHYFQTNPRLLDTADSSTDPTPELYEPETPSSCGC